MGDRPGELTPKASFGVDMDSLTSFENDIELLFHTKWAQTAGDQ